MSAIGPNSERFGDAVLGYRRERQEKERIVALEATIAARKAEFWAAVDDETLGETTNANLQQLEQILQDLRDSF